MQQPITIDNCVIKLEIPNINIFLQIYLSNLKHFFDNFNFLGLIKYIKVKIQDIICPIIVAITAPLTPKSSTNIAIGSNIIFNIAPIKVANIAYLGEPSALIIPFKLDVII